MSEKAYSLPSAHILIHTCKDRDGRVDCMTWAFEHWEVAEGFMRRFLADNVTDDVATPWQKCDAVWWDRSRKLCKPVCVGENDMDALIVELRHGHALYSKDGVESVQYMKTDII